MLLLIVLGALDRWVASAFDSTARRQYQQVFGAGDGVSQIILGTSHAAHGIHPRYLERPGFHPYNFAVDASSAVFYQHWYSAFRRYHPAPALVLLSVDWVMLRESKGTHYFEQDSEFFPPEVLLSELTRPDASLPSVVANRFPLVKKRDDYQLKLFGQQPWGGAHLDKYYRGYTPMWYTRPDLTLLASFPPIRPSQVQAMDDLLTRLQRDGARVILIQTPEYGAPQGHAEDTAIYERLARQHGVTFLDYNKARRSALNEDASLYNDWQHLNEQGAIRFTRMLARDLEGVSLPAAGARQPLEASKE